MGIFNLIEENGNPTTSEEHSSIPLYMLLDNMRIVKGFFFMNGTKPSYCSYGAELENVIGWKVR